MCHLDMCCRFPSLSKIRLHKVIWGSKWIVALINRGFDLGEEECPLALYFDGAMPGGCPLIYPEIPVPQGEDALLPPLTAPHRTLGRTRLLPILCPPVKTSCCAGLVRRRVPHRGGHRAAVGTSSDQGSCSFPCRDCCFYSGVVRRRGQSTCGEGVVQGITCFCSSEDPVLGGERR
ncbi:hypothetical protein FKM82_010414 [Ascaphus truei]